MAILDDSSFKIDPYYKTTNGYTHMYLASDDVLMNDDKTTLQTKMDSVENKLNNYMEIRTIIIPITVAKSATYKTTVDLPKVSNYKPFLPIIKGSGSNNVYNYYNEIRPVYTDGASGQELVKYTLYTEWKNANTTTSVSNANGTVNILYIAN